MAEEPEHAPDDAEEESTDAAENMTDSPSRDEIDAKLDAAEARTEARIAHLSSAVEIRYSQLDHKVDSLAGKMDFLVSAMSEMKSEIKTEIKTENRATRNMMWTASLGMLGIIVALVTWLYNAGLSEQANLLAAFQASLAVHGTGSPTLAPILGNGTGTVGPSTQPPATPSQPEKK